ncbi:MAG TPA: hypothetical protein VK428_03610 [Acidimicrobiales bacterium]|nr:hypothetical protein [Acidimicrobiales bacterium]
MGRSLIRRYLPLAVVLAAQGLIIGLYPSTAANTNAAAGTGGAGTTPVVAAGGSGNTSHCSGGREFSTSIDYYAPPCTAGTIGGSYSNGGSTYQGVTSKTVTVVDYYTDSGALVDAILKSEGLFESYQQSQEVDHAFETFINSHYVLWGRKLVVVPYEATCTTVPPDYSCLLAQMDSIVDTIHPYAVYWGTTLCSACFAQLAHDHTVAFGGAGFSDAFAQANAPYVWDAGESSTHIETAFAQFWCNQLSSKDSSRVVSFAPDNNRAQDFNSHKRVLGVISTNDPDNENTVTDVLVPALDHDCGDGASVATHHYFYSQDINTAAQQIDAGINALDSSSNPATDVLCICDPVAPELLYEGEAISNYWPENLLADVQGMGVDAVAQQDDTTPGGYAIGCPSPSVGCEIDDEFGITSTDALGPPDTEAGPKVYALGGGTNLPLQAYSATGDWEEWNMLASLIENTGPDLTPARMAAAAPSMGTIGGGSTGHTEVGFSKGSYDWTIDARVVYWDRNEPSPYNGKPGTFVSIEGSRYLPGQYPKMQEPPVPATRSS